MSWWSSVDWGSVAGAAASAWGASQASKSADRAGDQIAAGSAEATALQREMWQTGLGLMRPQYDASNWALGMLTGSLGGPSSWGNGYAGVGGPSQLTAEEQYLRDNPDVKNHAGYGRDPRAHYERYGRAEGRKWGVPAMQTGGNQPPAQAPMDRSKLFEMFRSNPGYQFGLDEGRKTVEAGAAAAGGLNSGKTLKALTKYGQDYADAKGWQPYLGTLKDIAGLNNSTQIAQMGQNYGQQVGQNYQNAANARAQSTYASGQAWQDGMANMAYFGGRAYDSWRGGR